jgi:hypothetical protein
MKHRISFNVISKTNYDLWTKEKIIPKQLKPMSTNIQVDITSSKKNCKVQIIR